MGRQLRAARAWMCAGYRSSADEPSVRADARTTPARRCHLAPTLLAVKFSDGSGTPHNREADENCLYDAG
jgi:hypothetical protein